MFRVLIARDRIAVLIGKKGSSRKKIEKLGKVKLWIDSNDGSVKIISKDSSRAYLVKQVVELIGRGFSPESACKLFDKEYFEIVSTRDFGLSKNKDIRRVLARLIGTKGKVKNFIENETDTEIVVYGKTVGILGKEEGVVAAKRVVAAILNGSSYSSAYKFLN